MQKRQSRAARSFLWLMLGLVGAASTGCQPGASLLVADPDAQAVHFFRLPEMELTGTLSGVKLGAHVGTLALADGRVIMVDEASSEFLVVEVDPAGRPEVVARAKADLGHGAAWGATDRSQSYFAVSSSKDGELQTVSLLDLRTYAVTTHDIKMKADEELHPYLAGEQLTLVGGVGGELQSFRIDPRESGPVGTPIGSAPVGAGGHGPVTSHKHGRVYISTLAGLDGATVDAQGGLIPTRRIPWDVDGRAGGRNGRPRLSWDGDYIYGITAVPTPAGAERWAEREYDVHMADLNQETARRRPIGTGLTSRFQISQRHAVFVSQEGDGDYLRLLDVDPLSSGFQKETAEIPLGSLTNPPIAGLDPVGTERRAPAVTPEGGQAFVSHGGDGLVSVVDTGARKVVRQVRVPTALKGGGYLAVFGAGVNPVDTASR